MTQGVSLMFNVYLHDGEKPLPTDDVCYIIAKDGIYLKKKLGVMESIAPVKEISILKSIQPTAKMNIKKIPAVEFGRIYEFFKAVYAAHQSEAVVLLFYNEAEKKYRIVPPHQKVTSAGAEYDRGIVMEGFTMVGTVHSHANFSAFHSGTDVNDEMNFDGLHITIGHVASDNPSITACIVANAHRVVVPPEDYASGIIKETEAKKHTSPPAIHNPAKQEPATGKQIYRIVNGALVRDIPGFQHRGYVHTPSYSTWKDDTRYLFTIPAGKRKFPEAWLTLVEKGTYTYNWRANMQHRHGVPATPYNIGDEWWDSYGAGDWEGLGWGGHFDASYWQQRDTKPGTQQPLPISHGPIIINNGEAPCMHCKYRDFKVQEEDFDVWYKCTKCNVTLKEDDDAEITVCPRCKSPDNLEEVEDFGLIDRFTPVAQRVIARNIKQVEVKKDSTFHKCAECGTTFNKFDSQVECPFCYAKIKSTEEYSKEEELQTQSASDSGEFLDPEFAATQQAASESNEVKVREAIADMKEQEKTIERIPDPEMGTIPIQERSTEQLPPLSKGVLKQMFRRVFGGKGNA
jgi:PRTRC genetic system protein A